VEPSTFGPPTNVFLYDRVTGGIVLVSHGRAAATAGASVSSPPSISADGRLVVFASREGNLDPGVDGPDQSTYLYDRALGTNRWIAAGASGDIPRLSADGGTVAFISDLPLLPGVEPDTLELYLYSVAAKTLTLATRSRLPGVTGSAGDLSSAYDLSADGRYVAFSTDAHDLVSGEVPPPPPVTDSLARDLYLFDRSTGATVLISRSKSSAVAATGLARFPLLSADGHKVAFTSDSSLADGDFNRRSDAYLFDLDAAGSGGPVTVPPCAFFDGSLRSNLQKVLAVAGSCGVPAGAHRVDVKVTARQGSGQGNLRLYPGDATGAPSGTLRFQKGQTAVLSLDLPLAANGAGTIAVLPFVRGNGTVRVTVEVDGYTP
jgi:Tol biopolymer transport system component